jgi:hypothetical protein
MREWESTATIAWARPECASVYDVTSLPNLPAVGPEVIPSRSGIDPSVARHRDVWIGRPPRTGRAGRTQAMWQQMGKDKIRVGL